MKSLMTIFLFALSFGQSAHAQSLAGPPSVTNFNEGRLMVTPPVCGANKKLQWVSGNWQCLTMASAPSGAAPAGIPVCFEIELDRSDKGDKSFFGGPGANCKNHYTNGVSQKMFKGGGNATHNKYYLHIISKR